VFVAIYVHRAAGARVRFDFHPESPRDEPECWAWAAEGSRLEFAGAMGCEMLVEPGGRTPRFAYELWYEARRREELPITRPAPIQG
jgi:hypothetical protein